MRGLYLKIDHTDINLWHLEAIQQALLAIFLFKVLALAITIAMSVVFGFWLLRPYRRLIAELKREANARGKKWPSQPKDEVTPALKMLPRLITPQQQRDKTAGEK